jgi:hypothetical protein
VLQTVREPPDFCLNSFRPEEITRHIPGSAQPSSKVVLPLAFTRIGTSDQAVLQPADAPPCACFHHSTLCENALAASFAGVVHPLHPLAGIDSARLLLFSGDAISYVSNRRAQSTLNDLNCSAMFLCSTASLLSPCPGWPASAA